MRDWHISVGLIFVLAVAYFCKHGKYPVEPAKLRTFTVAQYSVEGFGYVWFIYPDEGYDLIWRIVPDEHQEWANTIAGGQVKRLPSNFHVWEKVSDPNSLLPAVGSVRIKTVNFYAYLYAQTELYD